MKSLRDKTGKQNIPPAKNAIKNFLSARMGSIFANIIKAQDNFQRETVYVGKDNQKERN